MDRWGGDTFSSSLQIDETSTSPAQYCGVMDYVTCSHGNEEGDVALEIFAAGYCTIISATDLTLTNEQAAMTKGCGSFKFNHMAAFVVAD